MLTTPSPFFLDFCHHFSRTLTVIGNGLATLGTIATTISETKAGRNVVETGKVSNAVANSLIMTEIGWRSPQEAIMSTVFQATAVLNDFGIISLPFH